MTNYFSTQIYENKLITSKTSLLRLMNDLSDDCQQLLANDRAGHAWSKKNYVKGYTSYGSLDRLHEMSSTFQTLQTHIDKHIAKYISDLDYDISLSDLSMTHCWVNIMPAEALHSAHIHPLSVISGTFYLQTPKNCSSIKFEDPRLGYFMNTPLVKSQAKIQNKRFIEIHPAAGDVVLFESWLKHEVPPNKSKDPRVSISFNYGWNS